MRLKAELFEIKDKVMGLATLFFFPFFLSAQTPTPGLNSVTHYRARMPVANPVELQDNVRNAEVTVDYFDGLGRPMQTVGYGASPGRRDILSKSLHYDAYGRLFKEYLPAPSSSLSGAWQASPQNLAQAFHGDAVPFTELTALDGLDRPLEEYGPGAAWRAATRPLRSEYEIAGSGVRLYSLDAANNISYTNYPPNSLFRKVSTDGQGNKRVEIRDNMGLLVEKQVQISGGTYAITHYVHDGMGRLRAVIQPEGHELNAGFVFNDANFKKYVFFYKLNGRGNVSEVHIPGAGWTYTVFDRADRPVMRQDEKQRGGNLWTFWQYDALGRVARTGELSSQATLATLQDDFYAIATPYEEYINGTEAYTSRSFPSYLGLNISKVRLVNYYDLYDWIPGQMAFSAASSFDAASHWPNAVGLLTGSWARSTENAGMGYHRVIYYDNKGRVLQTQQSHHKGSPTKRLSTDYAYNFAGEVLRERTLHRFTSLPDLGLLSSKSYDHMGRILDIRLKVGGGPEQAVAEYGYDELGRLKKKTLMPGGNYHQGGTRDHILRPGLNGTVIAPGTRDIARRSVTLQPTIEIPAITLGSYLAAIDAAVGNPAPFSGLQQIQYSWHIRGGLRGINLDAAGNPVPKADEGDLFAYKLDYETAGQWDGNIGKQSWVIGSAQPPSSTRSYTYAYDGAKRLTAASYTGPATPQYPNGEDFSLPQVSYDKNGNITYLKRYTGKSAYGGHILADNLFYTYSGNRLTKVLDSNSSGDQTAGLVPHGDNSYTYYGDGSLKSDANKEITNIIYDTFLNKPKEIQLTGGRWVKMYYDGSGQLLKRQNSKGETWDYIGGLILKNGQFYSLNIPEGRAVYDGTNWHYEFEYRDVWNNLRVAFAAEGGQLVKRQSSDYDAFGWEFNKLSGGSPNNFRYQNQERVEEFGSGGVPLNIDFWKFRPSDPTIGRFWQIDQLASDYPYNLPYALQENKFGLGVELEGAELRYFNPKAQFYQALTPIQNNFYEAKAKISNFADKTLTKENILKTAKNMQDVGDGLTIMGFGLTSSVFGAEIGIPMATIGGSISTAGTALEIITEVGQKDFSSAGQSSAFEIAGFATEKIINKAIPGPTPKVVTGTANEIVKDIGKEVYKQSMNAKLIIVERATQEIQEKKDKEHE